MWLIFKTPPDVAVGVLAAVVGSLLVLVVLPLFSGSRMVLRRLAIWASLIVAVAIAVTALSFPFSARSITAFVDVPHPNSMYRPKRLTISHLNRRVTFFNGSVSVLSGLHVTSHDFLGLHVKDCKHSKRKECRRCGSTSSPIRALLWTRLHLLVGFQHCMLTGSRN
jgi:hypothetical protein